MHICQIESQRGPPLKAVFCPEKGMNLISFSKGFIEVIDQKTRPLFEERCAGLGALIGPHFHHRPDSEIPPCENIHLFPFIKKLIEKGQKEFFSHGIGRYVPWRFEGSKTSIRAWLSGEDTYQGIKLSKLEGQFFELEYYANLTEEGLLIEYRFQKERPGVIGLHYYYALDELKGCVEALVAPKYHAPEGWKELETSWIMDRNQLKLSIYPQLEADFGFRPQEKKALGSSLKLTTSSYQLFLSYETDSTENAWQLYHPKEATYVCLEPLTAQNPREPKLTSGSLKVRLKIE